MYNLQKFHLLDEKISQTLEQINAQEERYNRLSDTHERLLEELEKLRIQNGELLTKIEELKDSKMRMAESSINKEEIRKRIDRVLEKFGELQL